MINGHLICGSNDAVTTSYADVWKQNIVRTDPTTAVQLGMSSGNAADAAAGTGARTVKVVGLDANYRVIDETFTLNGQTKVVGTKYFLRVNYAEVLTAGSGGVNAGEVYIFDQSDTVTAGVPQTTTKIFGRIQAGYNQTQMAMYTTSELQRLRLVNLIATLADSTTTAKYGKLRLYLKKSDGLALYYPLGQICSPSGINPTPFQIGHIVEPKTDIKIQAIASAAGGEAMVTAEFETINQ